MYFETLTRTPEPRKRKEIFVHKDGTKAWIATVVSDSHWFYEWLDKALRENPPEIGEKNGIETTGENGKQL